MHNCELSVRFLFEVQKTLHTPNPTIRRALPSFEEVPLLKSLTENHHPIVGNNPLLIHSYHPLKNNSFLAFYEHNTDDYLPRQINLSEFMKTPYIELAYYS
ncbi:hypothetical protein TNCV_3800291 [Trichonephila clavipes]|nr:hypothetical protein TNCV_3800291 [Trichonephila clavipes]